MRTTHEPIWRSNRGFAIPLAMVVMVVVSMIATGLLLVAKNDLLGNIGFRESVRAFYASEAGATRTLAHWSSLALGSLAPGDSMNLGWQSLPNGAVYRTSVRRVDDGSGTDLPLFQLMTVGRPAPGSLAERALVTLVRGGTGAGGSWSEGALVLRGRLNVRGVNSNPSDPEIDGRDRVPTGWNSECSASESDKAGLRYGEGSDIRLQQAGNLLGEPASMEDRDISAESFEDFGGTTYAALTAQADHVFTRNTTFRGNDIGPAVALGACLTGVTTNWGEPGATGHPCWDHRPILHFERNLNLRATGRGQGILLVDGNLTVGGRFDFYGVIIVKGRLRITGDANLIGSVYVRGNQNGRATSQIRNGGSILYSSCAVKRVERSEGGAPTPLAGRYWFEILN